jgi:hypothetical protein
MKIIHIEDALDLAEKSGQESKVAASHPNQSDQYLRREWLIGRWPRFEKSVVCTIITNAEQPDNRFERTQG